MGCAPCGVPCGEVPCVGRESTPCWLLRYGGSPVELHPSSANADVPLFESRWLVYYEKVRTGRVYLRDSSMVTPYPLLLFGGELKVSVERALPSTLCVCVCDDR